MIDIHFFFWQASYNVLRMMCLLKNNVTKNLFYICTFLCYLPVIPMLQCIHCHQIALHDNTVQFRRLENFKTHLLNRNISLES